jgi:S-adenosylmethionine hydrolase
MKGVILGIQPRAKVVDITHEVPPGDIRAGAFALSAAWRFFPKGTVHVVVVDPGVGSARRALAVQAAGHWFVGPDNGVLSWALAKQRVAAIHALENEAYFLRPLSQTFHGRDVFAPVGAHLSQGVPIRNLGPARKEFLRLDWPEPRQLRGVVEGQVVYVDRFGNAITNLERDLVRSATSVVCRIGRREQLCPVRLFYQAVRPGNPVAVIGSRGLLEIAINGGSAEKAMGLRVGTRVRLQS